jgi:hypothetical protein
MITRTLWMLAASAALVLGQPKGKETPEPLKGQAPQKTVVVEVKNGDVNRIASVVTGIGANVRADPTLRVIAVSGDVGSVNAIEEAIKRMDVPPAPVRNVELTLYLLYASAQEVPGASVPADLESTVRALRGEFPYKSYRLLDSNILRARDGERVQASGTLPAGRGTYDFQYFKGTISGQTPRILRIDNLSLTVTLDGRAQITTNLDAREGQKTVVGKTNVGGSAEDAAVFLVISPKIIE